MNNMRYAIWAYLKCNRQRLVDCTLTVPLQNKKWAQYGPTGMQFLLKIMKGHKDYCLLEILVKLIQNLK